MTITTPTTWPLLGTREYAARAPVQAPDWKALAQATHYLWSRRGVHLGGREWPDGITSASPDLIWPASVPARLERGDDWRLEVHLYGVGCSSTVDVYNYDLGTPNVATVNNSVGGTAGWDRSSALLSLTDITDDGTTGGEIALLTCEVDLSFDSDTIYQIDMWANPTRAQLDLPINR